MAATPDQDPRNPHDLAVDIQTDLQKLATELAHAGAAPQAVSQLTKMAEVMGQVVKVLGSGPPPGAPGEQPPGPPQAQQGPPQPQAPPPGPPQPQGPPGAGPPVNAIHAATQHLHAAMQASKQAPQR